MVVDSSGKNAQRQIVFNLRESSNEQFKLFYNQYKSLILSELKKIVSAMRGDLKRSALQQLDSKDFQDEYVINTLKGIVIDDKDSVIGVTKLLLTDKDFLFTDIKPLSTEETAAEMQKLEEMKKLEMQRLEEMKKLPKGELYSEDDEPEITISKKSLSTIDEGDETSKNSSLSSIKTENYSRSLNSNSSIGSIGSNDE